MGRLKHQTATANRTLQHNGKLNTLVGGAVRRSYRYDQAGNLIQTADQRSGVLDYVYDKLGRIESAVNKQTGRSEKFAFDPAHNILSDKVSDGFKDTQGLSEHLSDRHHISRTKGRNIGKGNRLEAYNGTEYTYDALGNMIYRQLPNGESQLFQYDSENQLIRAEIKKPKGNTEIWEYAYDPFGRRLSKERKDKLAWTSTAPKRTHFVWDGTRLLQEYSHKGSYTYVYTDQDSYEPLAQIFDSHKDRQQYLFYFHNNQIGTPHEMTDIHGNLLWYGSYSAWGSLASEKRIYENVHQPFRLQNQYFDQEIGLHYNCFRYYEPDTGRFVNQDPVGLLGGDNFYFFAPNIQDWLDPLGLARARARPGTYGAERRTHTGGETNHVPAYDAYKGLDGAPSRHYGPAFHMDRADHRSMTTTGSSHRSVAYRAQQRSHIRSGRWDLAMEMDIRETKTKFGDKYDRRMRRMISEARRQRLLSRKQAARLRRIIGRCS
ncbi:RHS repeat domain-containing protein [Neisseria animaloris]